MRRHIGILLTALAAGAGGLAQHEDEQRIVERDPQAACEDQRGSCEQRERDAQQGEERRPRGRGPRAAMLGGEERRSPAARRGFRPCAGQESNLRPPAPEAGALSS